ncbi:MAG: aspartate-semialdehyde dehydrogenase [Acidimicrobiia bacterium]|nr:MAG: aspartate-semialdehyde dehydrogenase [Acidimicrobiia bacterium]
MNIAVVGATGAVGRTMLDVLEEREFPAEGVRLFASSRSAGTKLETPWGPVVVEELESADPSGIDVALFSAGADRSRRHAPRFAAAGAVVIDNSSAFRADPDVPLVVVGVNDQAAEHRPKGIIANPNCTTMGLLMAVAPLHRAAGLERMVAASYQSVSGSGQRGIDELLRQTDALRPDPTALASGAWEDPGCEVYPRPIGFNVVPFAGSQAELGYTDEEWKLVNESRKILDVPDLRVEPTCVRVPVLVGHGIAASLWFRSELGADEAVDILEAAPGVEVWTDRVPTPLDAAGRDEVLVGRLRPTLGDPGGISLWVVADNLRKGAALNAVQIAELVVASS